MNRDEAKQLLATIRLLINATTEEAIKPEPIECWAVVKDGGVLYIRERQKDAKDVASACKDFRVIQLREVV